MNQSEAVYGISGSFDPFTLGHQWLVEQGRKMGRVVILVGVNASKKGVTNMAVRIGNIYQVMEELGWTDVVVEGVPYGYVAEEARQYGVTHLLRGIRNVADYGYELDLHRLNTELVEGVPSVFLIPPKDLDLVSSSLIRSLVGSGLGWHHKVKQHVPPSVYVTIRESYLREKWHAVWEQLNEGHPFAPHGLHRTFDRIKSAYGDPARAYHNLDHLVHALTELDAWYALTGLVVTEREMATLRAAMFMHDFVYQSGQQISDEAASALIWENEIYPAMQGTDQGLMNQVSRLIQGTEHVGQPIVHSRLTPLYMEVLIGADLSILGKSPSDYLQYTQAIRQEYAMYDEDAFTRGRLKVVSFLLDKAKKGMLFKDEYFAKQYSKQAVTNLAKEENHLNLLIGGFLCGSV